MDFHDVYMAAAKLGYTLVPMPLKQRVVLLMEDGRARTSAEIAERLNAKQNTIKIYLNELGALGKVVNDPAIHVWQMPTVIAQRRKTDEESFKHHVKSETSGGSWDRRTTETWQQRKARRAMEKQSG